MDPTEVEQRLLSSLAVWSTGSVAVGAAAWAHGRHHQQPAVRAIGRQFVAWGAVDGAIAAAGWCRGHDGEPPDPQRAARLRRTLQVNQRLDLGYLALGAALVLLRRRLGQLPRYSEAQSLGDGIGILVQGGFLYWLDSTYARRLEAS